MHQITFAFMNTVNLCIFFLLVTSHNILHFTLHRWRTSSRYNPSLKEEWSKIDERIEKFREEGNQVMVEVLAQRRVELARIFHQSRRKRMRVASHRSRESSTSSSSSDSSSDSEWEDVEEQPSSDEDETDPEDSDGDEPFFDPHRATSSDEGSEGKRLHFRQDVTVAEIIGALIMLKTSHKVSWTLFLSIVTLIQGLLVTNTRELPMTMRSLKKFFKKLHGIVPQRVLFCVRCEEIWSVTDGFEVPPNIVCDNCDRNVSKEAQAGRGSFIYIPTIPQLKSMVRSSGLYEAIQNSREYIRMFFRGERMGCAIGAISMIREFLTGHQDAISAASAILHDLEQDVLGTGMPTRGEG